MSNYIQNPLPGYLVLSSPDNNREFVYAQPLITNIPGFPSSFSGAANANIVVNNNASGVTFIPGDSLAIALVTPSNGSLGATATTQITFTTQASGSLSYNMTTGDVLIPLTGWYLLICTFAETTLHAGDGLQIAISNGSGAVSTVLSSAIFDGIAHLQTCSVVAKLTQGNTVGAFFVNPTSANSVDLLAGVNFSIKYIA